jgi:hypothetical protein
MTPVWDKIEELADYFDQHLTNVSDSKESAGEEYNWHNKLYTSDRYRRAHIEIVDKRDTHGIYILHTTIFPHVDDPSPIFGFDAVCGKNKITGAFHDFSRTGSCIEMEQWFADRVKNMSWNKPRVLPEWAQQIFSPSMVAAGNVQGKEELESLCQLARDSLDYYLSTVGQTKYNDTDLTAEQNRYCYWQKQNPHVIRSMVAMGIPETTIQRFVEEVLFPEI